jgi:hypothetical protein
MSGNHLLIGLFTNKMTSIAGQLRGAYAEVFGRRAFYRIVLAFVTIAFITYLLWKPVTEQIFAWMRWHLWGYPA